MTVRHAIAHDAPALHTLAALTFPLACTPQTPDEEKAAFIAEHLTESAFDGYLDDPALTLLVATGESELIGYSMLSAQPPSDPGVVEALRLLPTIELSKLYVHPAHHGDGTARRLIEATIDSAKVTGAAGIWLGVSEENARANAFYARHGFERVGRKRFHIGDRWEDDYVRERAL